MSEQPSAAQTYHDIAVEAWSLRAACLPETNQGRAYALLFSLIYDLAAASARDRFEAEGLPMPDWPMLRLSVEQVEERTRRRSTLYP